MEIDVVIPAYNEEAYLPACLAALRRQTVPVHLIVLDNNSTDKTAEIASQFGATVISEGRQGIGSAKRAGLLATTSPLVLMTDADTITPPHWAEILTSELPSPDQLAVVYSPALFHDAGSIGLELYSRLAISGRFLLWVLGKPHYQGNSCAFTGQIRQLMENADHPQAGEGGRIFREMKLAGGDIKWLWNPEAWVLTSARRVKEKGLVYSFIRRAIHLSTGNSNIAYASLYSASERGVNPLDK